MSPRGCAGVFRRRRRQRGAPDYEGSFERGDEKERKNKTSPKQKLPTTKERKKKKRLEARKKTKETVDFDAKFCNVVTRYDPNVVKKEAIATTRGAGKAGAGIESRIVKVEFEKKTVGKNR